MYGPRLAANMTQNRPKEVEDLLNTTSAKRGYPLMLGICSSCSKDYYSFSFGLFCSNKCAQYENGDNGAGYKRITVNGKRVYEHRHVTNAEDGIVVHHINGDKQDNRAENLELMTQAKHCAEHQDEMKAAQYGILA